MRGHFAINQDQYNNLLTLAPSHGLQELFVLSTCNRTEIYGFAEHPRQLVQLLCSQTEGNIDTFFSLAYIKKGREAIEHLFEVGAGLDSQILGDYEIVGQIKQSVKFAREKGFTGTFTDRLVNNVLQSSKAVKNQTALSGGTVSVSFAAVQYIRENVTDIRNKKIILLGIGKIGSNTCKNLVDYLDTKNITLLNRTPQKAKELAAELQLKYAPLENLEAEVKDADIIVVATNSAEPTIAKKHVEGMGEKLIIDLSVPYNVDTDARHLPNVHLVNVDDLSRLKDKTLQKRQAEVPKAQYILHKHIGEFLEWFDMRRHVPVLKAVKTKLKEIQSYPLYSQMIALPVECTQEHDKKIQRVINGMASKMRLQNQRGCHYIEAINEFIATGTD